MSNLEGDIASKEAGESPTNKTWDEPGITVVAAPEAVVVTSAVRSRCY
jgi:hypothetical protein